MSAKARLRLAWSVAILGALIRLVGDASSFWGARVTGNLILVLGLASALCLMFLPKVGDYKPNHTATDAKQLPSSH